LAQASRGVLVAGRQPPPVERDDVLVALAAHALAKLRERFAAADELTGQLPEHARQIADDAGHLHEPRKGVVRGRTHVLVVPDADDPALEALAEEAAHVERFVAELAVRPNRFRLGRRARL